MKLPEVILEGDESLIPIDPDKQVAVFSIALEEDIQLSVDFFNYFAQALQNDCDFGFINDEISDEDFNSLFGGTIDANVVVFLLLLSNQALITPARKESLNNSIKKFSTGKDVILVSNIQNDVALNIDCNLFLKIAAVDPPSIASSIVKLSGRIID